MEEKTNCTISNTRAMDSYHILYLFIYMYALTLTFGLLFERKTIKVQSWFGTYTMEFLLQNCHSMCLVVVTAWFLLIWARIVTFIEFHAKFTHTHTLCTDKVHTFIKLRYANIKKNCKFNMLICAISYDTHYTEEKEEEK